MMTGAESPSLCNGPPRNLRPKKLKEVDDNYNIWHALSDIDEIVAF